MDLEEAARRLNEHPVVDSRAPAEVLASGRRYRRHRTMRIASSATVALALVVAVVVVSTQTATHEPSITVVRTTPSTARPAANRQSNAVIAGRIATESIDEVVVPWRSILWTAAAPAPVARPGQTFAALASIKRHRIWSVPMSSDAFVAFLHAHHPEGSIRFESVGTGEDSSHGVVTRRDFSFEGVTANPAIQELGLDISVSDQGPNAAWVRADAQVIYRPDRASDEFVSTQDRVVVIEQTSLSSTDDHKRPYARVVVTNPADVQRLRDTLNGLLTMPDEFENCPMETGTEPVYRLSYQRTTTSAPDLVATTRGFCIAGTAVTVRGHSRPGLEAGALPTLAAGLVQRLVTNGHCGWQASVRSWNGGSENIEMLNTGPHSCWLPGVAGVQGFTADGASISATSAGSESFLFAKSMPGSVAHLTISGGPHSTCGQPARTVTRVTIALGDHSSVSTRLAGALDVSCGFHFGQLIPAAS